MATRRKTTKTPTARATTAASRPVRSGTARARPARPPRPATARDAATKPSRTAGRTPAPSRRAKVPAATPAVRGGRASSPDADGGAGRVRRRTGGRAAETVRDALGTLPGRVETPGQVKRRLLVVATVAALAISGGYAVMNTGGGSSPFTNSELQDLSGLPKPPVRLVQEDDGSFRQLTPEEQKKLSELQELIRNFPAPAIFGGNSSAKSGSAKKKKGG